MKFFDYSYVILIVLLITSEHVFSSNLPNRKTSDKEVESNFIREARYSNSVVSQRSDYINRIKDIIIKAALREQEREAIRRAQQFIEAQIYRQHLAPKIKGSFANDFLTMRY